MCCLYQAFSPRQALELVIEQHTVQLLASRLVWFASLLLQWYAGMGRAPTYSKELLLLHHRCPSRRCPPARLCFKHGKFPARLCPSRGQPATMIQQQQRQGQHLWLMGTLQQALQTAALWLKRSRLSCWAPHASRVLTQPPPLKAGPLLHAVSG